jgi:hypothetical protein
MMTPCRPTNEYSYCASCTRYLMLIPSVNPNEIRWRHDVFPIDVSSLQHDDCPMYEQTKN